MKFRLLALFFSGIIFHPAFYSYSQEEHYGLPGIQNFTRADYKGGTQNWSIAQAANGMMYFANNNGLVEYDGAHWSVYNDLELIYRALCIDGKRIYVGGYNKIGYYEENESGIIKFHSLIPLIKNRITDIDEIWRIHKTSFGIVFQSFKAIFIYNQDKIEVVYPRSKFHFSYYVNGILWVYDEHEGLMQYREGKVRQIPGGSFFSGTEIWTLLPLNDDQVIVGTAKKGLFRYDGEKVLPWENPLNELLKKYQLFSGAVVTSKYMAFGTIQNGLIIADTSGRVVFHLNKERGILNNTVLSIGTDRQGDIWLGLDNGISVVHFNSPLTFIRNYFDIGSGYTSAQFGGTLYLGTNQGLFYIPWKDFINPQKKKEDFHLIEGTEGQVWNLSIIDNSLFCGHNLGVFQIINNKAFRISSVPGGWTFLRLKSKEPLILVGHYNGLSVLVQEGDLWRYRNEIAGFDQSSHFIEQDSQGDIWISHGYKGIYQLQFDSLWQNVRHVTFFDTRAGLPQILGNNLFHLQSGLVVGTRNGIYRQDAGRERFLPDSLFSQLLPGYKNIDYISQDKGNNIWYYHDQQPGVLRLQEDGSLKNITAPFLELKRQVIPSYGHVNVLDDNNVLIGLEGGFAHYASGQRKDYSFLPVLHISRLQSSDTSEGFYRFNSTDTRQNVIPRFRFRNNTISLVFAASQYADQGLLFQFKLEGFDPVWSAWSEQNTKEYTNLPGGEYTFRLKAQTINGRVTQELSYKFIILFPWYRSFVAWITYLLLFLFLIYFAYRFFLRSLEKSRLTEKEKQRQKYREREQKLKEEALIADKEMIRLRNETLNLEMIHKEKELANSTMLLIKKNNILNKIKTDLKGITISHGEDLAKASIGGIMKRIDREIDNEKQWQVFNLHVEQVYEELLRKLKERYPDLTPRELSLCAYLRMNISSKEIATLMNISARGVEISRYRIRKKLKLDRNANLTEFMINL
jgi:ligand-binding sensor domain-containing protein/DNA-binding CsgD family transcriptional regulator